mmetsp:Transcript_21651/g.55117  ORF Transcript_21651/g.55117 Transcript_21651/m.55117 type:complete len:103 (-) Transcript_21651:237-545(-)
MAAPHGGCKSPSPWAVHGVCRMWGACESSCDHHAVCDAAGHAWMVGCTTADSACDVPSQVFFIDFGQSKLDPTPAECEEELLQLRSVMSGSPGSDRSAREHI